MEEVQNDKTEAPKKEKVKEPGINRYHFNGSDYFKAVPGDNDYMYNRIHRMRRFYVFFHSGSECRKTRVLRRFLKHPYTHCWFLETTLDSEEAGVTTMFIRTENLVNVIETEVYVGLFPGILKSIMEAVPIDLKCLRIDKQVNPLIRFTPDLLVNCVTISKKCMGIRDFLVQTPFSFYKHLKRIGAKRII
mmetsp:Transcript_22789/g.10987  ORF Transcript_22789/g.10987 Transcript_22789/m.10987 type:complete len:190 (+) Transcript_22789:3946-4515(+)